MKIRLTITRVDGTTSKVETRPADLVAFERHFGIGFPEAFDSLAKMRIGHQFWLAWHAETRPARGQSAETLDALHDAWLDQVDDVDVVEEAKVPLAGGGAGGATPPTGG